MTGADKPLNSKINIECTSKLIAHSSSSAVLSVVPVKNYSELVVLLLLIWTPSWYLCTFTEWCEQLLFLHILQNTNFRKHHTFHCLLYQCSGPWFSESDFVPFPSCMALYCLPPLFFLHGYSFMWKFLLLHQNSPCSPPLNFLVLDPNTAVLLRVEKVANLFYNN